MTTERLEGERPIAADPTTIFRTLGHGHRNVVAAEHPAIQRQARTHGNALNPAGFHHRGRFSKARRGRKQQTQGQRVQAATQ